MSFIFSERSESVVADGEGQKVVDCDTGVGGDQHCNLKGSNSGEFTKKSTSEEESMKVVSRDFTSFVVLPCLSLP